ncbi:MAG: hypothetical protein H0T66_05900 [Geodermatophilaceae bacterium]|nr:hypothetical protein [Geodermatophilaceae bacterium]
MAASSKGPVRTVMLGWVTFLLMTVAVVLVRGADHVANMAVFAAIGVAMLIWVALRRGRAALIASLVLGLLHVAEQIAYLLAGGTDSLEVGVDVLGLVSGLLLVAGASWELRRRRAHSDPPYAAAR